MAVGDIWRLAFVGVTAYQEWCNIWHVKFKSIAATPAGAATAIDTNFYTLMAASKWGGGIALQRVEGRQLAWPQPTYDAAMVRTGVVAGDMLPTQIAMVATLRTGMAGRSYRGRLYLNGFTEGQQSASAWDVALVAAIQTYFDDLVAAYGSGGADPDYEWGVWSKKLGEPALHTYNLLAGWHPITEVAVRGTTYTQRRRTIGVGV